MAYKHAIGPRQRVYHCSFCKKGPFFPEGKGRHETHCPKATPVRFHRFNSRLDLRPIVIKAAIRKPAKETRIVGSSRATILEDLKHWLCKFIDVLK